MNEPITDIVLVGGGLAAAKAAETLRERGYDGRLTLVGEEPHPPYERPPLSKKVLTGDDDAGTTRVHPQDFYVDQDIEMVTGDAVTDIDRNAGKVTTRSGRSFPFDRLLLATGASPRELPLTDRDLEGIHTLRSVDDSLQLHDALTESGHVTIIGAGWIGCEVAAAARALDTAVTLVDPLATPLERVLGSEVGGVFADLHREQGVDLRLGVGVANAAGGSRVQQVTLTDDTSIATDLVVVGIGVAPRVDIARAAGLEVDNGIVADATLVTSDPRIYAAGDVANAFHPHYGHHLRVEHWANALNQGQTAGANLLCEAQPYERLPYFYSDQYDLGMEYVGHATDWDEVVFRGDREAREFIAFWLRGGRVTAAMNVNVWDVVDDLKALVRSGAVVDVPRLIDLGTPLADLADHDR